MTIALRLAESLIACRSITPADGGCRALLSKQLQAAGFVCEALDAGPAEARVSNLWAVHGGSRPGPMLVFAGHTDVVPTGPVERWASDPFVPSHRGGRLYGRGAADMKTAVACMTVAAVEFVRAQPQHAGSVALLITSDEEGPSLHGTLHCVDLLQQRGIRFDGCIIGEPTSVDRVGHVAKGTYTPQKDPVLPSVDNSGIVDKRQRAFYITQNIMLLGGYPSGGGTVRNWVNNPTILSGDIGVKGET